MMSHDTLTKLYVEITSKCNLTCTTCIRNAWDEHLGTMDLALFETLLDQIQALPELPTLHFGGYGEPMSHPNFLAMVRAAKRIGLRVEVTTNGTLLNPATSGALIEMGLDRLVVSIDGITPELYSSIRPPAELSSVVSNLADLRRMKIRKSGRHGKPDVAIAFVAMKQNVQQLAELPRLATRIGAWEILVSNLIPHTADMESEILYEGSLRDCAYRASRWVANMSLPKMDVQGATLGAIGQTFNSTASISLLDTSLSARNNFCPFVQKGYAAVRWDGQVSPCLALLYDYPVYLRHRRKDITHYSVGSLREQTLADVWESDEYAGFRQKLRAFPYSPCTTCGGCERFAANFVDCTENSFPTCGGCLWAQGFIQCP